MNMHERVNYAKAAPGVLKAMLEAHEYLQGCGLEHGLMDLIYLRVSQMNGCAFCLDMHWKDLRAAGECEQRLYLLDAWRESPGYSDRERTALTLTEAVTRLEPGGVPDAVWESAAAVFDEAELGALLIKI